MESATIDKLALRHILIVSIDFGNTWCRTFQVDKAAVCRIIFIGLAVKRISISRTIIRFTYNTFFTATEHLEHIALIQVDRGATPNLGAFTLTATKHVKRLTQYVHTLLTKDHTCTAIEDVVMICRQKITLIETFLAVIRIRHHFIKEFVAVDDSGIQIYNDIAVDDTTLTATAIDVSTYQTALVVCILITGNGIAFTFA